MSAWRCGGFLVSVCSPLSVPFSPTPGSLIPENGDGQFCVTADPLTVPMRERGIASSIQTLLLNSSFPLPEECRHRRIPVRDPGCADVSPMRYDCAVVLSGVAATM